MTTFTAFTTLPAKSAAEALGEAIEALDPTPYGVGVFEIEDGSGRWEVGGYFLEAPDEIGLALLAASHGAREFVVSELPETDWVAQVRRELHPVRAGRFYLYGSHDADTVPNDAVPLLIEAAMAFGTGHHGTTSGCLIAFDRLLTEGHVFKNVVDIGCGTAVLALAAARVFPQTVLASDIDEIAVDVARVNAQANDLADRIEAVQAAGFDHPTLAARAPFDLIFANILKGPLIELAPDMARHAAQGGYLILSGLLLEQAEDVTAAYLAAGFERVYASEHGEWAALTLRYMG